MAIQRDLGQKQLIETERTFRFVTSLEGSQESTFTIHREKIIAADGDAIGRTESVLQKDWSEISGRLWGLRDGTQITSEQAYELLVLICDKLASGAE